MKKIQGGRPLAICRGKAHKHPPLYINSDNVEAIHSSHKYE